jgi:hypothetical protein
VPYFTSRDADEVLLLVGNVLKGQKVDPYNLTPSQQTAVKTALETSKVDNWMARKYKKSKADRDEVSHNSHKHLQMHVIISSSSSSSPCANGARPRHNIELPPLDSICTYCLLGAMLP